MTLSLRIAYWMFLKRMINQVKRYNKYEIEFSELSMDKKNKQIVLEQLHFVYNRMLNNIHEMESECMDFTLLKTYVNYKISIIKGKLTHGF